MMIYEYSLSTQHDDFYDIPKDMKKLGFKFVGSTIIYSYMQAVGVVNDHVEDCAFKLEGN